MKCRLSGMLIVICALWSNHANGLSSDLYAAVEQSAVNKVVNDAHYPLTLIDQSFPFNGDVVQVGERIISGRESQAYRDKAKSIDCNTKPKELACAILAAYTARDQQIENIRKQRDQVIKSGKKWNGPDESELTRMEADPIEFKPWLAYLKIDLEKAPDITISGIATTVKGVSIDVDAIGQLWVKHPAWNCTSTCSLGPITICCGGYFDEVWDKVLEVPVRDVKIATDATITFSVSGVAVYATPSVQYLALDYDILRDINLAPIANSVLAGEQLLVLDASKIVAAVPYVNTKYSVGSVALSGNGEIRADITIVKVP